MTPSDNDIVPEQVEDKAAVVITEDYRRALDVLNTNRQTPLFITGNAGTGKSTLLRYIRQTMGRQRNIVVVAPTGVAALNVEGQTIHSFFRIPIKPMLNPKEDIEVKYNRQSMMRAIDMIIVDEVSMVRPDLLDCMDFSLREHRGKPKTPFGGVQMVFFGDLCQLPPVVTQDVQRYMDEEYSTPYFFSAHCLRDAQMGMVELKTPFRQQGDPQFLDILNRIRDNSLSLMDVDRLNVACGIRNPWAYERRSNLDTPPPPPIELTSTNEMAHAVNREQLATIDAPVFAYEAYTTGQFDTKLFPTEGVLRLKVGAQVMLIRNDKEGGYVNGSIGKVVHLAKDEIVVDIDGEECDIERVKWDRLSYDLDAQTQMMTTRSMGTFEQYPIRLGWAVTIHKSQGQTFDRVIVDFGRGAFAHGQAYVALSRCRTMAGLRLRTSFKMSDVQFDDRILEFHKQFDTGQV